MVSMSRKKCLQATSLCTPKNSMSLNHCSEILSRSLLKRRVRCWLSRNNSTPLRRICTKFNNKRRDKIRDLFSNLKKRQLSRRRLRNSTWWPRIWPTSRISFKSKSNCPSIRMKKSSKEKVLLNNSKRRMLTLIRLWIRQREKFTRETSKLIRKTRKSRTLQDSSSHLRITLKLCNTISSNFSLKKLIWSRIWTNTKPCTTIWLSNFIRRRLRREIWKWKSRTPKTQSRLMRSKSRSRIFLLKSKIRPLLTRELTSSN